MSIAPYLPHWLTQDTGTINDAVIKALASRFAEIIDTEAAYKNSIVPSTASGKKIIYYGIRYPLKTKSLSFFYSPYISVDAHSIKSWKQGKRFYLQLDDGDAVEINKGDWIAHLTAYSYVIVEGTIIHLFRVDDKYHIKIDEHELIIKGATGGDLELIHGEFGPHYIDIWQLKNKIIIKLDKDDLKIKTLDIGDWNDLFKNYGLHEVYVKIDDEFYDRQSENVFTETFNTIPIDTRDFLQLVFDLYGQKRKPGENDTEFLRRGQKFAIMGYGTQVALHEYILEETGEDAQIYVLADDMQDRLLIDYSFLNYDSYVSDKSVRAWVVNIKLSKKYDDLKDKLLNIIPKGLDIRFVYD